MSLNTIDEKIRDVERIEAETKASYVKQFAELDSIKEKAFNAIADAESKVQSFESIIKAQSLLFPTANTIAQLQSFQTMLDSEKKRIADNKAAIEFIDNKRRPELLEERATLLAKLTAEKQRLQKLKDNAASKPINGDGSGTQNDDITKPGGASGGKNGGNSSTGGLQWWAWALIGFAILIVLVSIIFAISRTLQNKRAAESQSQNYFYDNEPFRA